MAEVKQVVEFVAAFAALVLGAYRPSRGTARDGGGPGAAGGDGRDGDAGADGGGPWQELLRGVARAREGRASRGGDGVTSTLVSMGRALEEALSPALAAMKGAGASELAASSLALGASLDASLARTSRADRADEASDEGPDGADGGTMPSIDECRGRLKVIDHSRVNQV